MAQKIGDAFVEISARLDKFTKQIDGASKKVQTSFQKVNNKLSSAFKGLGGVIAGAFAVEKIAAFTLEAVKLAAEAEGVSRAFSRIADDKVLEGLTRATKGTVSQLELMRSAVVGSNLGVPIKEMASLFEFATQRANETGQSVTQLVSDITTGIGRKSPLILDNLGISAIQLKGALGEVSMEAATVGQIAEAVGKIASQSMAEIGDQALTSAQKIAQMQANLSDAQTEFGKNAMPLFLAGLKGINVVLENINEVFGSDKSFFERLKGLASQINPIMLAMKLFGEEAQTAADKVKETDQNVKNLTESLKESEGYFDFIGGGWVDGVKDGTEEVEKLATAFDSAAYNAAYLASVLDKDMSMGGGGDGGALSVVPEFEEEADFEDYDANLKQLAASQAALNEQISFGSSIAMGFGFALTDSLTSALDGAGNFFDMMGKWILDLIKKLAAAAAAAFLLTAIFPGLGSFGALFGQFSGFGGLGGGGSLPFELGGKVRGNDLYIANQRTGNTRGRIGG